MSASEPPIINVTDEIMPLLNQSASKIQRLNRAVKERRKQAEKRGKISSDMHFLPAQHEFADVPKSSCT